MRNRSPYPFFICDDLCVSSIGIGVLHSYFFAHIYIVSCIRFSSSSILNRLGDDSIFFILSLLFSPSLWLLGVCGFIPHTSGLGSRHAWSHLQYKNIAKPNKTCIFLCACKIYAEDNLSRYPIIPLFQLILL